MSDFDPHDQQLLTVLQQPLPLVEEPFAVIAQRVGLSTVETLRRITALRHGATGPQGGGTGKGSGVIRQISAIFDSRSLGYQSLLVAAKVPPEHLEAAAAVINQHPGVSHNYQRNHAYNLWYTLALPPDSRLGLERTIEILRQASGALAMRPLPSLRMFKIGVRFDVGGGGDEAEAAPAEPTTGRPAGTIGTAVPHVLTEQERILIRLLQQDLPLVDRPFDDWAQQAGLTTPELLAAAQRFLDLGLMRRFSAVLRHRAAGIVANAMGVWEVPPEKQESFGLTASGFAQVSHCYARPTFEDWPYSLFTMVHATTPAECESVMAEISKATGITRYGVLYSTREFKKV
ncbi:MAG: Lrp/AsnC family transcriptional regulator, partial [Phycisphaerae bacterium]